MAKNGLTPSSLYGNSRDFLKEQEHKNELLAQIAGESYTAPAPLPNGEYLIQKRLLDAAEKENELLEAIADGAGTISGANKLAIDYGTDVLSLKKNDTAIADSGVTLPAYGISFDHSTGGLTLTKNGTAISGQTVTIPNYGSPVAVEDSTDMTDHDTIYLYEGTTGETYTNGHFYYWDGSAWADGGEYAAATVQTDKTLIVEDRAADAKAVGDEIADVKAQLFVSTGNKQIEMTVGAYYPLNDTSVTIGSPTEYETEKYALVPCNAGDVFTVSGTGGSTAQPWAFVASDGTILAKTGNSSTTTVTDLILVAPENTAYLILNNQTSSDAISYFGEYLVKKVDDLMTRSNDVEDELKVETTILADTSYWERYTISRSGYRTNPIGTSGVGYEASTTRIVTKPPIDIHEYPTLKLSPSEGYKFNISFYNEDLSEIVRSGEWADSEMTYTRNNNEYYATIIIAKTNNTTITTSDYNKVTVKKEEIARVDNIESRVQTLETGYNTVSYKSNKNEYDIKIQSQLNRIDELLDEGKLIPAEYVKVEYIESSTTNSLSVRINTELVYGEKLRTELDMQLTDLTGKNYMGREGAGGRAIRNAIGVHNDIDSEKFYFAFGNENLAFVNKDTERHLFYIDVPYLVYGVDDNQAEKEAFTYGLVNSVPIYLFGIHESGMRSYAKLYSARFYNDGVLVAYFVPVVRLSDKKPGVYDVIRKQFFTNTGNGTFTVGKEIKNNGLLIDKTDKFDLFSSNFNTSGVVSSYLFFTDPHIFNNNVSEESITELFESLKTAYDSTPTDFVLCGGDWLQGGDADIIPGGPTVAQACGQLGFVDGVMRKLFDNYKPMFGNHDSNYKNTALSQNTVNNLMFRKEGKSYYKFESDGTVYYVFDSGLDYGDTVLTNYRKEQLTWFATALETETVNNIVICVHSVYSSTGSFANRYIAKMGEALCEVSSAYNNRENYTASWDGTETHDYTGKSGKILYAISGHMHHDVVEVVDGIPVVITKNALYNYKTPTFDLCVADYYNKILCMSRIGNGVDRYLHYEIASGTLTASKITPANWQTSDDTIATVNNGVVTIVSSGFAVITAKDSNNNEEAWIVGS